MMEGEHLALLFHFYKDQNMPVETPIPSKTGYSCPNCEAIADSPQTLVSQTKPEFNYEPDPHYAWEEIHKCQKCGTLYTFKNNT